MLSPATLSAIKGAFELFLNRRTGLSRFDLSFEGFWRSFAAAIYVLPMFVIFTASEMRIAATDNVVDSVSTTAFLWDRMIGYAAGWVAMPILLALFARRLGITRSYSSYIIVSNWASVLNMVPPTIIVLGQAFGLLPDEFAYLLGLASIAVTLQYQYRLIGFTLMKPPPFAVGLIAASFALDVIQRIIVDQLFGV